MKTLKQSTLLIMIFSIVTRLTSFFFKVYLSRRVGAEVLGLFQMTASVFGLFCTLAASGIPPMLSRRVAELGTNDKNASLTNGVMTGAILLSLGVVALLIFGAIIFRDGLSLLFSDERCVPLFYILLPTLLSTVLYQLLRGYFMGKRRYFDYSVTEFLEEIIKILACMTFLSNLFLSLSDEVAITIAFTVTDYLVMGVLLALYFIKGGRLVKPKETAKLFTSALPVTGIRVAAGLISSFIAITLPAALIRAGSTPSEAAAEYGRAVGMAFSLLFAPLSLTSALSVVILPEAASLSAKGETKELRMRIGESLIFIFVITVLFYALFIVLGESYGVLLFKDAQAGKFLACAAGMVIPAALSGFINTTLNSLGEERKVFLSFFLSALFLILSVLFLPRHLGIYALAVGECAFYLVNFIIGMVFLSKKQVLPSTLFKPAALTLTLAFPTALAIKGFSLLSDKMQTGIFLKAAIPTVGGVLVYLLFLLLFKPIPNLTAFLFRRTKRGSNTEKVSQDISRDNAILRKGSFSRLRRCFSCRRAAPRSD